MKQYEERINEILSNAGEKATDIAKNQIRKAETALSKAEADVNKAFADGDDTAYLKAKEAKDSAEELLKMHKARALTITDGPLISEEEYNAMVSGILSEMSEANDRDKREVVKLCEEILAIADRNLAMIEEGNDLLHRLQYDVYRGADVPKDKDGQIIPDFSGRRDKQFFDRNSLFGWAYYALKDCAQYTALRDSVIEKP